MSDRWRRKPSSKYMGLSATLACSKLAVLGGKGGWVRKRAGFVQVMTIHSSSLLLRKNLNPHDVVVVQCNNTHDTMYNGREEKSAQQRHTGTGCRLQELNREKEERAVAINPLLQTPFNFADKKRSNNIFFFACALLAVYRTGNRGLRMRENESVFVSRVSSAGARVEKGSRAFPTAIV